MTLTRSWVASANSSDTDFPLNNLPYGVFSTKDRDPRCGVAIGDMILDCAAAEESGLIDLGTGPLFDVPFWNEVMEDGPDTWAALRARLTEILAEGSKDEDAAKDLLVARADAEMHMPFLVAEYTDFYAGRKHAENMGAILRGSPELPANWLHIPIGYNGRASTVVVSGTDITRPNGQTKAPDADAPSFGPCKRLDIELEIGAIVGGESLMGQPITTADADAMIFGYVLLNDWSARDIQGWEYQPLGPFQAKAFATSVSPWIVTKAALEPFRTAAPERTKPLLPYLQEDKPGCYDIDLSVTLKPAGSDTVHTVSRTNASHLYYSAAQQLTHHASSGCAMTPGDLLGSGTISGPTPESYGSLMEMTNAGKDPLDLDGAKRTFIEDGDTLGLHGHAQGTGYRIGFGDCMGTILPAPKYPA